MNDAPNAELVRLVLERDELRGRGGRIWAEGSVDEGATARFTIDGRESSP